MIDTANVAVVKLPHGADLPLPAYATAQSAGMDLMAAIAADLTLAAGQSAIVPTGLAIALPEGFEAQIRPRSGLAAKNRVTVLNAPGTIDADYRGEIGVILINLSDAPVTLKRGERIAQLLLARVERLAWDEVAELPAPRAAPAASARPGSKRPIGPPGDDRKSQITTTGKLSCCIVALRADIVERTLAFLDGMLHEATTSTQRDLIEGRPSELEALNGAVVRLGRQAGVPTPVNEFVYASLLPWERRARETR